MYSPDEMRELAEKPVQCVDLNGDRELGAHWEREFCKLAAKHGRAFTPHQLGRPKSAQAYFIHGGKYYPMTLPDITIWTRPGEHHEVKHKDPTQAGYYGLERYRLDALRWFADETGQSVYYTIHDYSFQRGSSREKKKLEKLNDIDHWLTCAIAELADCIHHVDHGQSWVGGKSKVVERCYWHRDLFQPVKWLWIGEPQRDMFGSLISVQQPPAF